MDENVSTNKGLWQIAAALVDSSPDLEVVGIASDGRGAIEAAGGIDIVLMDLNLPSLSGVEATVAIVALPEPPAVLVVTMVDDDDTVVAAMRAGARRYILKGAKGDEVVAAVRTVAAGGAVFGAGVAAQVLALASSWQPARVPGSPEGLTSREREVLELLAGGAINGQIALELSLSLKTVQNYVSRILDKLQVSDRTQAALREQARRLRP